MWNTPSSSWLLRVPAFEVRRVVLRRPNRRYNSVQREAASPVQSTQKEAQKDSDKMPVCIHNTSPPSGPVDQPFCLVERSPGEMSRRCSVRAPVDPSIQSVQGGPFPAWSLRAVSRRVLSRRYLNTEVHAGREAHLL